MNMTWFWRLVCSPDCSEACQVNCPGCRDMASEWESQGRASRYVSATTPVKFRLSRAHELWSCWSRSVSARTIGRINPARLVHRGGAPAARAVGCGCEPAGGVMTSSQTAPAPRASACGCHEPAPSDAAIKDEVQRYYAERANGVMAGSQDGCCGPGLPADVSCTTMYPAEELKAVPAEALIASLGCGNPLARADLQPGDVVLDLGSGGGMDVFVAAGRVAPTGRVFGLDMSDEMLTLARANAERVGATNVEFLKGEMESIPLPDDSVDVIISNCVVNLAPDKRVALREAYRVLRPGGRLAISDIVTREPVPAALKGSLTAWAACIGGALSEREYQHHLSAAGFVDVEVERDREYTARDAESAGLTPLLRRAGLTSVVSLGFASTSIRARKASAPPPTDAGREPSVATADRRAG
jgi:SAM-dependent methyltransferase